jgi:hypothetical protein
VVELRDVTMLELAARMVGIGAEDADGPMIDAEEAAAGASPDDRFGDAPLFGDDPPLFDDGSMFDEESSRFDGERLLFDDDSSLFDDPASAFDTPDLFRDESDSGTGSSPPVDRNGDRGPGGRWRPATGGR